MKCVLMAAALLGTVTHGALAAEGTDAAAAASEMAAAAEATGDDIVVTAPFGENARNSTSPVSVIDDAELDRELRPQIGDVLARQPGVSTTSFGPNVSRPILRGFSGERVRVLTEGIGAFDVSNTSADHAVAIDPLLAERIEVLRGPGALRFGSSAIGGVVNMFDRRIPSALPDGPVDFRARAGVASAARERSAGGHALVGVSDRVALSIGGSLTDTSDLRIGGPVLSERLRNQARASSAAGVRALGELRGRIPNTSSETRNAHIGVGIVDGQNNLGVSVSRYESIYGLPIRFNLTPGIEQDAVSIDAEQTRADVRATLQFGNGLFETASLRGGYADYAHVEREADGSAGTLFVNEGYELRGELRTRQIGAWRALIGGQTFFRDFLAVGAEAFVPPNETVQSGAFMLHQLEFGALKLEAGGRVEGTSIRSEAVSFDRSFTVWSGSVGGIVELVDGVRAGINLSSTARAPAAEELLANGPHIGTQSYEIGDPSFGIERANGIELLLRANIGAWRADFTAYSTRFSGYIYEFETGEIIDDLPVFRFAQGPARYSGFEVELAGPLIANDGFALSADATVDFVRADIRDFGPAPRIPPFRVLAGLDADMGNVSIRAEVEHAARQDRVAGFETTTPGFTLANVSLAWAATDELRVTISANNVFDVDARRHASFLKEYAPLAGRDLRLGISAAF